jgi:uncharacterized protein (TIGR01777 family)
MKIVLAGGTGFIGKVLTDELLAKGYEIIILSRNKQSVEGNITYVKWLQDGVFPEKIIKNADAFINLAGVSINEGRWSANHQKQIYNSRMEATDELLRIIASCDQKPSILINASAIGIYPTSKSASYNEKSKEVAKDFLGQTVNDWEQKAATVEKDGIRTVFMRFGVVLGRNGGALTPMLLPYKLFAGGTVGSGEQWLSWVHIKDVTRSILFALEHPTMRGPVNVTSPNPKRMKDFGKTIGAVLKRPHWIPVPAFSMKLILGKKSTLVLEGQHVTPEKLIENGFEFQFPTLNSALEDLLINKSGGRRSATYKLEDS